jgi:hypothetical protein
VLGEFLREKFVLEDFQQNWFHHSAITSEQISKEVEAFLSQLFFLRDFDCSLLSVRRISVWIGVISMNVSFRKFSVSLAIKKLFGEARRKVMRHHKQLLEGI